MKILAVDFDGTLATTAWPKIGKQKLIHKIVLAHVKRKQKKGWMIAIWTLRENKPHKEHDYLSEAKKWCYAHDFYPDLYNDNPRRMTEKWGYSRKLAYDRLIDDKNYGLLGALLRFFDS